MSKPLVYNLGNPNSPKFNLFGYTLLIVGLIFFGLAYFDLDALGIGVVGVVFGGVVVTSRDGVIIDMTARKLKGYTSLYGYKYGEWENLDNYISVCVLTSHRVWKLKYMSAKYSDVTPREFVVCLLNKSHRKKQNLKRFENQQEALSFAQEVSDELNLPIERYQSQQLN
jgi:hypothetical protein